MSSIQKCRDLVARSVAGETIVVPIKSNVGDLDSIYTLDEVGTRIWQLMDECASVEAIVKSICQEYDVDSAEAERDVSEFLCSLETAGLIRI